MVRYSEAKRGLGSGQDITHGHFGRNLKNVKFSRMLLPFGLEHNDHFSSKVYLGNLAMPPKTVA